MPKAKANKAAIGAWVQYCGHAGSFIADLIRVGSVVVVSASGPVAPGMLNREVKPSFHLSDCPTAGYWNPSRGVFVVPESQISVLS